ncbi:unnamed protein product [Hyaloperonospora brassicae]|uniref:Embryonic stem cell-specific 5-hydroxymethylcytosine-binding protein n=1 Tax=Hyaloperonospora brassicae TaxID=162125 RepID=A0AAV0TFK1_HYABA|nr:unnamed protein product [Hyaloperonospora brassicae]
MCGRSRCTLTRQQAAEAVGVSPEEFVDGDNYNPVENMGPGRYGPVLLQYGGAKRSSDAKPKTRLQAMRWGLVPSFTKAGAKPDHFLMFNARSESLQERPAFKRLVDSKRCAVVCEGYYEWHQVDKREKQPYYFYRESSPMKFAGLYDCWKNEEGKVMYTYTILTTSVAPEIKWLHNRMPVILSDEDADRWLSRAKLEDLTSLLQPYQGDDLKWHPVDKKVGSTRFQGEECAKPVDIKHAADIKSFFGVKTEKPAALASVGAVPITPDKTEEIPNSETVSSLSIKNEEREAGSDTRLAKQDQRFSTKFVPASSLVDKTFDDDDDDNNANDSFRSEELNQKRRRVSHPPPTEKTPTNKSPAKLKTLPGPKQSSLDFFSQRVAVGRIAIIARFIAYPVRTRSREQTQL